MIANQEIVLLRRHNEHCDIPFAEARAPTGHTCERFNINHGHIRRLMSMARLSAKPSQRRRGSNQILIVLVPVASDNKFCKMRVCQALATHKVHLPVPAAMNSCSGERVRKPSVAYRFMLALGASWLSPGCFTISPVGKLAVVVAGKKIPCGCCTYF